MTACAAARAARRVGGRAAGGDRRRSVATGVPSSVTGMIVVVTACLPPLRPPVPLTAECALRTGTLKRQRGVYGYSASAERTGIRWAAYRINATCHTASGTARRRQQELGAPMSEPGSSQASGMPSTAMNTLPQAPS